jgi:hypothetical protein
LQAVKKNKKLDISQQIRIAKKRKLKLKKESKLPGFFHFFRLFLWCLSTKELQAVELAGQLVPVRLGDPPRGRGSGQFGRTSSSITNSSSFSSSLVRCGLTLLTTFLEPFQAVVPGQLVLKKKFFLIQFFRSNEYSYFFVFCLIDFLFNLLVFCPIYHTVNPEIEGPGALYFNHPLRTQKLNESSFFSL